MTTHAGLDRTKERFGAYIGRDDSISMAAAAYDQGDIAGGEDWVRIAGKAQANYSRHCMG